MRQLVFHRVIGSGAFGTVYRADLVGARGFRRPVAIKVLAESHPDGEMFVSRVRDEARLLGLLQDEHILKVLELVRIAGRDAVVMEFVEGIDLAAVIDRAERPPPRALAELGADVAGALHTAHTARHPTSGEALNVVHRDVKPANVMLTDKGGVKLLDFGVAQARFAARESRTGQFVLGTLNYMAPEYITTGEVSPAADIYGLALTLWEAAAGEVFGQPKLKEEAHARRLAERLRQVAGTHAELVPVLTRMLDWNPRARPDGAEVARELTAAADQLRGTGLRSWAVAAVAKAMASAERDAQDGAGLVGKTLAIGDGEGDDTPSPPPSSASVPSPAPPAKPVPAAPAPPHSAAPTAAAVPAPVSSAVPPQPPSVARPLAPSTVNAPPKAPASRPAPGSAAASSPPAFASAPPPPASLASALPQEATMLNVQRPAFLDAPPRAPARPAKKNSNAVLWIVVQGLVAGGLVGMFLVAVIVVVWFFGGR